ncbi:hypothetical protein NDU88_003768 [Pleurodeles waltl]|uniref:Uncharacterized protein n=1 Tax=Pleurodeles waltl TaxID=8319 RepID=A0AAV7T731_PLEWA|nr:hypothetical protein NDU88_003768 [Pleurodeles waltl]
MVIGGPGGGGVDLERDTDRTEIPPEAQMEHTEIDGTVTHSFLEALFGLLWEDLQTVKQELSQELRAVQRDLVEIGDHVFTLDDNTSGRDEQLKNLQQEVIHLKEQQIDMQAHTEALENRLQRNNICIRSAPTAAEVEDINSYVKVLFVQIMGPST